MQLLFSHLNLRFNPFGELSREERSQVTHVELDDLPALLTQPRQAVQFIGGHGRGKSTHLIALHTHFDNASYTQIQEGSKPIFKKAPLQFVDSIDFLSKAQRRKVYKKSHSLAFTTHVDLTKELVEMEYEVHSRTISQVNTEALQNMFTNRIEFARRDEGEIPTVGCETIAILQERYKDDIRAMELCLYDIFQEMKEIQNVQV